MSKSMRNEMIDAVRANCVGNLQLHKTNIEIYLNKSVGIGEHPDVLDAVEKELEVIAKYDDQLDVIKKYFEQDPLKPNTD